MEDAFDLGFWLALALVVMLGVISFDKAKEVPPAKNETSREIKGVFYCPQCKTIFLKYHPCCPEEWAYGECIELKPTPYKTWEEYQKGTWRP